MQFARAGQSNVKTNLNGVGALVIRSNRAYLLKIVSGYLSLGRDLQWRLHVQGGVLVRSMKVLCLHEFERSWVSRRASRQQPFTWIQHASTINGLRSA